MKIIDVDLTLFNWDDIPPTRYHAGSVNSGGRSNLGLLTVRTDQGIEGHAFLGGATNPAETDAGALIRFLKPVLMGKDPLQMPPGAVKGIKQSVLERAVDVYWAGATRMLIKDEPEVLS